MWKSACVGVYQLLNWKMHGETLKIILEYLSAEYWEKSTAQCKMKMDSGESEWITNWTT